MNADQTPRRRRPAPPPADADAPAETTDAPADTGTVEQTDAPADTAPAGKTIYAKLAKAQAAVGTLPMKRARILTKPKDGRPAGEYTYEYVPEGTLGKALRQHLAEQNVAIIPNVVTEERLGGGAFRVELQLVLQNGEEPWDSLTLTGIGYGSDSADKGYQKALTTAMRLTMVKLLLQGDEDESGREGEQGALGVADASPRRVGPKPPPAPPRERPAGDAERSVEQGAREHAEQTRRQGVNVQGYDATDDQDVTKPQLGMLLSRAGALGWGDAERKGACLHVSGGECVEFAGLTRGQATKALALLDGAEKQPEAASEYLVGVYDKWQAEHDAAVAGEEPASAAEQGEGPDADDEGQALWGADEDTPA